MGPDACRTTELAGALRTLGQKVTDLGNITAATVPPVNLDHSAYGLDETIGWAQSLAAAAQTAMADGIPVFLGGYHALSLGSVAGVGRHAAAQGRPQFVLWLDAHSDFHTAQSSHSGNLHGTPLACLTGRNGFPGFPVLDNPIPEANVCKVGLRSVEHAALAHSQAMGHDMRDIDRTGIAKPLAQFLTRVTSAGGALHVSWDVDFLAPQWPPPSAPMCPVARPYAKRIW